MGIDVMDFPYYFPGTVESAVSISPYPFSLIVSEQHVSAIVRRRCGRADNFYFFIRASHGTFGPFIDGLRVGRPAANVEVVAPLADGIVYRMTHCDQG